MEIILFDDHNRDRLLPFTFTRPIAEIRVGIFTIAEKWEKHFKIAVSHLTQDYLQKKYTLTDSVDGKVYVSGSVYPTVEFLDAIRKLTPHASLMHNGNILALNSGGITLTLKDFSAGAQSFDRIPFTGKVTQLERPWQIFKNVASQITDDFDYFAKLKSEPISSTNQVKNPENIFIEAGAKVEFSIINAEKGPVYIGKNAEVMEGCLIRGPFSLGEGAILKMGAKVYGPTVIGPYSKVGGEVNNSVIFGYSNKSHDGFLGNSVIGEWCNLGADTNNSNLKNNYGNVKIYSYAEKDYVDTGLQFCGLMMGDHSKAGINTMFNTGTVVGVSSNIYGSGFPDKHIPSFKWGGAEGWEKFKLDKAIDLAENVYSRRGLEFNKIEKDILSHISSL